MYCTSCGELQAASSNYCSRCGSRLEKKQEEQLEIALVQIASAISCQIEGPDEKQVSAILAKTLNEKKASKILFNIYGCRRGLFVVPAAKDNSKLALFGLMLGGGALASAAITALDGVIQKNSEKQAQAAGQSPGFVDSGLFFSEKSLSLAVKEIRPPDADLFDLFKKETWFKVSGPANLMGTKYDVSVVFGFAGQVRDPNKKRLDKLDQLCSALGRSIPEIFTSKNTNF